MKRFYKSLVAEFLMAVGVLSLGALSGFVVAATPSPSPQPAPLTQPKDTPDGSTLEQRIAQRKAEQNVVLDKTNQDRLVAQCKNAQTSVLNLAKDVVKPIDQRNSTFQKIDAKILIVIGQYKLAGKDTFDLEQNRTEYVGKLAAFTNLGKKYKQSLDDLGIINCQADPAGFKALLQTARAYRAIISDKSAEIKNYVVDHVKPTITDYAGKLEPTVSTQKGAQ